MEFLLIVFTISLFALNMAFIYLSYRHTEGTLKKQLKEAEVARSAAELQLFKSQQIPVTPSKTPDESYLDSIINSLNLALIGIQTDGTIYFLNKQALKILGFTPEELKKKHFTAVPLKNSQTADPHAYILDALKGKSSTLPKHSYLLVHAGKIPVKGSIIPLFDSNKSVSGCLMSFYDATHELEEAQKSESFFSTAAHELRTPLTIVKSSLTLILESGEKLSPTERHEMLLAANQAASQLSDLVNDFLNVSRIQQGRLVTVTSEFDLISLVKDTIYQFQSPVKAKHLYLNFEQNVATLPKMSSDKNKIREVLVNLISNALKYTFQGGITVSVSLKDNYITILVSDTGVGIPKEKVRLLFGKFQQIGEARAQSTAKSTGLGLYISKQFAQSLGGDLLLEESEPGKGTTFVFTVPLTSIV